MKSHLCNFPTEGGGSEYDIGKVLDISICDTDHHSQAAGKSVALDFFVIYTRDRAVEKAQLNYVMPINFSLYVK